MDALTARIAEVGESARLALAELSQDYLDQWCHRRPEALASTFHLSRLRVLSASDLDLVDEAEAAGRISDSDIAVLYNADLVIAGREGRGESARDVLVVVEVAYAIDHQHLDRVLAGTGILSSVGYVAYPLVVGRRISAAMHATAGARGVAVYLRNSR